MKAWALLPSKGVPALSTPLALFQMARVPSVAALKDPASQTRSVKTPKRVPMGLVRFSGAFSVQVTSSNS